MTHGGQASIPERERVSQELYGTNYKELNKEEKKEVVDHAYGAGHTPPERVAQLEAAAEQHKGEGPKQKPGGG
ncbi:hypothetical protein HYH02_008807 [Chlamydomonas schloesseri]|uniref:Uncharacterized protein n=1 Tax=Chlamydomonas schloesseri TaxID=2026947 RepID=A0A836B270_9CHLO|nr:hypothetical protein HYH02_008807 [Chlamydomonas schloesseri]|eukprot:KAG2445342.1 hypothetical protein HYH02_008807 [Chlamydomonas schloesseri]